MGLRRTTGFCSVQTRLEGWSAYGFASNDWFLFSPNAFGGVVGVWGCVERLVFVQSKRVWRGGRRMGLRRTTGFCSVQTRLEGWSAYGFASNDWFLFSPNAFG